MSHTYEKVLQYEVARELFNTRIARCSARLDEEQANAVPDAAVIGQVHADMAALVHERERLSLTADAEVAAAIRRHRVALAGSRSGTGALDGSPPSGEKAHEGNFANPGTRLNGRALASAYGVR